jgi:hypothetical protein
MTDVIHNYPKSSCTYWECNKDKYPTPKGPPTNMSVSGCNFSEYYNCYPKRPFKVQTEPVRKSGQILLNSGVVNDDKFDNTFRSINVKDCPGSSCIGTTYLNSDPRLYNQGGTWLQLDKPPLNSSTKLSTLTTDKNLDCYGQGYTSYADVNAGQYLYYISKDREDAFYEPLFSKKANTVGTMYQDPMGAMKPQYDRIPDEQYNPILDTKSCGETDEYCLSFIKDTQFHREDILARQMRKRNEQRYEPRWTNNNY